MKNKTKEKVKFYLYNIVVVLIFLSLFEILSGFLLNHPEKIPNSLRSAFSNFYRESDRATIQVIPECAQYDPDLFYTLKPGNCYFKNREFNNLIEVNSIGTRDSEAALRFPEIVMTGDSFTMGWGVDAEKSFPSVVKTLTGKPLLNAGISSYGTAREMRLLERVQLDSMKVLIIQYHPNDSTENKKFMENDNQLVISDEAKYLEAGKMSDDRTSYFFGKYTALIFKQILKGKLKKEEIINKSDRNEAKYFLNSLVHSNLRLENVQIVLMEMNNANENDDVFLDEVEKQVSANDFPLYIKNIKTIRLANLLSEDDYYILDNHINEKGHEKVGQKLFEYLQKL